MNDDESGKSESDGEPEMFDLNHSVQQKQERLEIDTETENDDTPIKPKKPKNDKKRKLDSSESEASPVKKNVSQ